MGSAVGLSVGKLITSTLFRDGEGGGGRSDHAEQRREEGRRVSPARNDAQRAREGDVFVQDNGRYVVRGSRGREHIFEADGTHIISVNRSGSAHAARLRNGQIQPVNSEQFTRFQSLFR